jgi:hypothetical protein
MKLVLYLGQSEAFSPCLFYPSYITDELLELLGNFFKGRSG